MTTIHQPSVMSLLIEMRFNGTPIATGTGFVVNTARGHALITNRHNVTGRRQDDGQPLSPTGAIPNELVIAHNAKGRLGTWVRRTEALYNTSMETRWVEHPVLGARADVVALPLMHIQDVEFYPYDPSNPGHDMSVGPADIVSVIGFPFGLTGGGACALWATGFMASEPQIQLDLPVLFIDCRSRPGQSGSAVIAFRNGGAVPMANGNTAMFTGPVWRFLGVYSGRVNSESDIGIVWKASAVEELVASIAP